jgi:hypothetical protein
MACVTPPLDLPPKKEFGNFTPEFTVGFELDGYNEYNQLDEGKHNVTTRNLRVMPTNDFEFLPHAWPPYDESVQEPLDLNVSVI